MMRKTILTYIKELSRPIFTTSEMIMCSGKSASNVVQGLNYLAGQGLIFKIYRGIWAETNKTRLNPFSVIPFLLPRGRAYISFLSALHFYGLIEQIPQMVTVAAMAHTKTIRTKIATYSFHRVHPSFFKGFVWDEATKGFLIAEPEKALVDSLYLSAFKKKQYTHYPELDFPKSFSFRKAIQWTKEISNPRVRNYVQKKLEAIIDEAKKQRL